MKKIKINKRRCVTVLVPLVALIVVCIPFFIKFDSADKEFLDSLSSSEMIAQILASLFVVGGSVIAVWQYYITSRSERSKIEIDKIQKAVDLAEYYKNEILAPYTFIRIVYNKCGIFDILYSVREKMNNFDLSEMNTILTKEQREKIEKILQSKEIMNCIVALNMGLNLGLPGCKTNDNDIENESKTNVQVDTDTLLYGFNLNYINKILNNMEVFSMYFTHNVADESVVYQSLYPTYIEMCRTLYYDISIYSKPGEPKLYRNLQRLYNIWNQREIETNEQIKKAQNNPGSIAKNFEL